MSVELAEEFAEELAHHLIAEAPRKTKEGPAANYSFSSLRFQHRRTHQLPSGEAHAMEEIEERSNQPPFSEAKAVVPFLATD